MKIHLLDTLLYEYPLPEGWREVVPFEDAVAVGSSKILTYGLQATSRTGRTAFGSAGHTAGLPVERAYFELLERISIFEAIDHPVTRLPLLDWGESVLCEAAVEDVFPSDKDPSFWRYSRSNGVALHRGFSEAAISSCYEVIERDVLLRSWFGSSSPQQVFHVGSSLHDEKEKLLDVYDVQFFLIGSAISRERKIEVFATLAFPKVSGAPLSLGFGAHDCADLALRKSFDECVQRIGFLWGSEVSLREPDFSPTPDFHQALYLFESNISYLKKWLGGGLKGYSNSFEKKLSFRFADLTPTTLKHKLRVLRAVSHDAVPLFFGKNFPQFESSYREDNLAFHPLA